jgi:aryl-alcohol dehydrogenase-like predicted oxidoreductase
VGVRLGPAAIAGSRRADQVDAILFAATVELTGDDIDEIEARTR